MNLFRRRIAFTLSFTLLLAVGAGVAVSSSSGQDANASPQAKKAAAPIGKRGEKKKPPFVILPKPLDEVESNALKLEETGLFKIVKAEIDYVGETQERGLVWTLRTQRRATVRRALLLLTNLRDARFYYRSEQTKNRLLVHQTVLEYSSVLDGLASRGKVLLPTEEIKVWLPLTDVERRRVIGRQANYLELGRLKREFE